VAQALLDADTARGIGIPGGDGVAFRWMIGDRMLGNLAWIVFWGVITFSLLVVLHEAGHFVAARAFGLKVHEFMVGLPGPRIRLETKNTTFGITAIPLGGYVRIAGMEPGEEDALTGRALAHATRVRRTDALDTANALGIPQERAGRILATLADWGAIAPATDDEVSYDAVYPADSADDPDELLDTARSVTYRGQSTWKRIVILSAGVVVNLVTAILVFTIVLAGWGYYQQSMTLSAVEPGTGAYDAGLQAGDTITALDGEPVEEWMTLSMTIAASEPGDEMAVTYERNGIEDTVVAVLGDEGGAPFLGVQADVERVEPSIGEALLQSFVWTGLVFRAIIDFFNPETFQVAMEGARGVIGISVEVAEAVRNGPLDYAWLIALLSLSLGVMNILPIPPLDGGKVMLEIIEKVKGSPMPRNVVVGISLGGVLLLFSFIGYVMYADVMRYIVNA
jgi:regulator of sigma E protease